MDSNIQIQTLKSQIENMKLQIDNISMQNNNMLMKNAPISSQLINLSIPMLNTGIQTFNIGKTMMIDMNMDNFYEQLKKVSEQINTMINEYKMQQMMIQQQIMLQQQMAMQNQMMMQQQIKENQNQLNDNGKSEYIYIKFVNSSKENLTLTFKSEIKVKEALNKYIERIYGYPNDKIDFVYNAKKIDRNELRTIGEFFDYYNVLIQVLELGNMI